MNILDKIVARKREEIAFSKSKISVEELKNSEFFGSRAHKLGEAGRDVYVTAPGVESQKNALF
jgi:hypothetical protein